MESGWRAEERTMSHTAEPTSRPWLPPAGAPGPVSPGPLGAGAGQRLSRGLTSISGPPAHKGVSSSRQKHPGIWGKGTAEATTEPAGTAPRRAAAPARSTILRSRPRRVSAPAAPLTPAESRAGEPLTTALTREGDTGITAELGRRRRLRRPGLAPLFMGSGRRRPRAARSRERRARHRGAVRGRPLRGGRAGDALSSGRGRVWAGQSSS